MGGNLLDKGAFGAAATTMFQLSFGKTLLAVLAFITMRQKKVEHIQRNNDFLVMDTPC